MSSSTSSSVEAARAAAAARPTVLRTLYPALHAYRTGMLPVSSLHTLYWEESGNSAGAPVVVIHGGPGSKSSEFYRRFFDPKLYRIIQYDQRGAGKSTPHASLVDNTTTHLVADIEVLRAHLNVDKWVVYGGSWGSTLSLAYSQSHPTVVKALILRGIFLLRKCELDFFYQEGTNYFFPDEHAKFKAAIPEVEHGNLLAAYHRRLTQGDDAEKLKCATAWSAYENATSRMYTDPASITNDAADDHAVATATIESHYFVNGGFIDVEDQLLRDVHKIRHIPATIIQGRYDMVCPMKSAYDLAQVWPEAEFHVVADAGHTCREAGTTHYLIEACDKYATL